MDNNASGCVPDKVHKVTLLGRKRLELSGVRDVDSFDDREIRLKTNMGALRITGEKLHVERLSLEEGEVDIEGKLDSMEYLDDAGSKREGSFLARLLK